MGIFGVAGGLSLQSVSDSHISTLNTDTVSRFRCNNFTGLVHRGSILLLSSTYFLFFVCQAQGTDSPGAERLTDEGLQSILMRDYGSMNLPFRRQAFATGQLVGYFYLSSPSRYL